MVDAEFFFINLFAADKALSLRVFCIQKDFEFIQTASFDLFLIHEPERVLKLLSDNENTESCISYLMTSFQNYLKREEKAGRLHPVMPVKKLLDYIFSVFEGILLQYTLDIKAGSGSYDAKASVNAMYRTLIALLGVE